MFKAEIASLGGLPDEILQNDEMFDFFEPVLRADIEIADTNDILPDGFIVTCPIHSLMGTNEKRVDEIQNWRKWTTGPFSYNVLNGNHFFIYEEASKLADNIIACYGRSR